MLSAIRFDIAFNKFEYEKYFPRSKRIIKFGGKGQSRMTISDAMDWWFKDAKQQLRTKPLPVTNMILIITSNPG